MPPILALTRHPGPRMDSCELTHLEREPIDGARLAVQHARYVEVLRELGCDVVELPAKPELPDAIFVEDTAIVLDELAVITRPGAASRRPETGSVARALRTHRQLLEIEAPATLDGGDALLLGRTLYVGLSSRSNQAALAQLREGIGPLGYRVCGVQVRGCLHLKSAVCPVEEDLLLVERDRVDVRDFAGARILETDPAEAGAANALRIGGAVLHPAAFPRTRERMQEGGLHVIPIEYGELAKAEGGVTCCSLLVRR